MANLATQLKAEITRVSRKEAKAEVLAVRKIVSQQRAHIASLRRQVEDLGRAVKQLQRSKPAPQVVEEPEPLLETDGVKRRFSPTRLIAHREKLGITVAQYAELAGVSAATLRSWELGKKRPTNAQIITLVGIRSMKPDAPVEA